MGNTLPQLNSTRSGTTTKDESTQYQTLKKSRSLREYSRSTSLINSSANGSTRKNVSLSRQTTVAPTDAEIIDITSIRCALPVSDMPPDDGISSSNITNQGENHLNKQLDYIRSCVRKDKGLFGKIVLFDVYL
jgi:hypothetical protein